MQRIYLDHAATTPLAPEALESMLPWLKDGFGNPSSLHAEGRAAREAIDVARERLSGMLGCEFGEVTFTSSGTEAANLAILGLAFANAGTRRSRILLGAAEHHCVLHTRPILERLGFTVETLPVDPWARIDVEALQSAIGDDALLVAAMHANNEVGTIQPLEPIAENCQKHGALLFSDGAQTFRAWPWSVSDLQADLVSISAHKVNGPKGVGALYIRAGVKLLPQAVGGGQERELRAGTENVAAIVGFAEAAAASGFPDKSLARDAFLAALEASGAEPVRTIPPDVPCLGGHAHLRFPGCSAESMLILLDRMGIAASSGAACSSGSLEPSHVLLAAGYSEVEAKQGLRFTFGAQNTFAEAREAAHRVAMAVASIRNRSVR